MARTQYRPQTQNIKTGILHIDEGIYYLPVNKPHNPLLLPRSPKPSRMEREGFFSLISAYSRKFVADYRADKEIKNKKILPQITQRSQKKIGRARPRTGSTEEAKRRGAGNQINHQGNAGGKDRQTHTKEGRHFRIGGKGEDPPLTKQFTSKELRSLMTS